MDISVIEKSNDFNMTKIPAYYPVDLRLLDLKKGVKSVKFPVEGLNSPTICHAIQHHFSQKNGIESVIANHNLGYFFVRYRPREIRLSRIIDLLSDWGVKSNVRIIFYPITDMLDPEILIALTQRLLSCRFLLDVEWNEGANGMALYLNPDYVGQEEAQRCINNIVTEEMKKITSNYEKNDN